MLAGYNEFCLVKYWKLASCPDGGLVTSRVLFIWLQIGEAAFLHGDF